MRAGATARGDSSSMIAPPPDAAKLASELSQCIGSRPPDAGGPGKAPLKLLHWALGQLEECARTRSAPSSNVVEVAMAAIQDEIALPAGEQGAGAPVPPAATSAAPSGGGGGDAGNAGKCGSSEKKPAGAGTSGGGRGKGKGVVFTPLYGCEEMETSAGVGPVSSILEVRGHTVVCPAGRRYFILSTTCLLLFSKKPQYMGVEVSAPEKKIGSLHDSPSKR